MIRIMQEETPIGDTPVDRGGTAGVVLPACDSEILED
jgi:hypothetical protein